METKQMQRWTDAKLDKELAFARGFADPTPEAVAWLKACEAEAQRRAEKKAKQIYGGLA